MTHAISEYLAHDHDRLDGYLLQALSADGTINTEAYHLFRQGLMRHIGIEEKILIPALLSGPHTEIRPAIDRIRLDHSAVVALLVPAPSAVIITALRTILTGHNALEEENGGIYERGDLYDPEELRGIAQKMKEFPEVRSLPNNADPKILEATRRALQRAGYDELALMI